MVKFTNEQRLEIIKNYYRHSESVVATLRALTPIFGRNNRPTRQTVRAIVDKFESTYSLLDVPVPVRKRAGRSTDNIAAVSASVENEPNQSTIRRSQELGISQSTLYRILRKDLRLPKRPLSAYMLWLDENREAIKKDNPGIKVTEIAKRGGELWRAMKDKSEWEARAAKDKDDYEKAIREYEANGDTETGAAKKRGKVSKKPAKRSKKDESEEEDESD